MIKEILADKLKATQTEIFEQPDELLQKVYFFHDIRVICQTNSGDMLSLLDDLFEPFHEPEEVRGEILYYVLCYRSSCQFPLQLPSIRLRTDTIRLLPDTILKCYTDREGTMEYQVYAAIPSVNGAALTATSRVEPVMITQLEMPGNYRAAFLRRYIFLLALGEMMSRFGFEPFHAAAITAPDDGRQGALIIGSSGSGKTTLSLGCAVMGCGLLGDDLVMLRENREQQPVSACAITHEVAVRSSSLNFLKSLAFLRAYQADLRDKRYCSVEAIRPGAGHLHAPVRLLLFPLLTEEAESRIIPLSKASTLQELIEQGLPKTRHRSPEALFDLLSHLAQQASGYRLALARRANDGPQIVQSLFTGRSHE